MELLGAAGAFGIIAIAIVVCIGLVVLFGLKADKMRDYRDYLSCEIEKMQEHIEILKKEERCLKEDADNYNNTIKAMEEAITYMEGQIRDKQQQLETSCENVSRQEQIERQMEETSRKAFSNFCSILEQDYEKKDKEYNEKILECQKKWEESKKEIQKDKEQTEKEIEQLKSAWRAIQEAAIQQEKLKEKQDFFRIVLKEEEISDILLFEDFKKKVNNKRAVSMLIWSTWFQKPMTALCTKVLGPSTVCGIYKITNIKNNRCYIGQAVDVATRFKNHAKCGLGIDTPENNKLYKAMLEDGLWNFTWELLEKCSQKDLNEREKYYIDAYMSKDFGYNTLAGISKGK